MAWGFRLALAAFALTPLAAPAPVQAQFFAATPWKLVKAGEVRKVGKSNMAVTAVGDWNRNVNRQTGESENWTQNGTGLDDLGFYAAIKKGEALFRQRDKKKDPLPKFDPAMLPTDVVEWFENSVRNASGSAIFEVTAVRPARLAGHDGVEMDFAYASEGDNLERRGLARAAIIDQRLYLISYDAPKIHYFDEGVAGALAVMNTARIVARK